MNSTTSTNTRHDRAPTMMSVWGVRVLFGTLGAVFGSWAVRIPDIAANTGISSSTLGVVLLVLAAGSLVGMPVSGVVLARCSLRLAAAIFATYLVVALVAIAASHWTGYVFVMAFALGLGNGVYGIVINTSATHLEHALGRSIVPSCHAAFSVATLAASVLGGVAIGAGLTPVWHMLIVAVAVGAPSLACVRWVPSAPQPEAFRFPRPRSLLVWIASGVAFTALFAEGVITDWSAFFLQHEVLGGPHPQQAWGYSFFAVAMACGRGFGGALITRIGERRVLLLCLAAALGGYVVVVTAVALPVALVGFACVGLGLSNIYPCMISVAARGIPAEQRQDAVASVSSIGYFGFLLGPAAIGGLSGALGIRDSLISPIVILACGAVGIVYLVRRPNPSAAPG